jgi:hypothetical protein
VTVKIENEDDTSRNKEFIAVENQFFTPALKGEIDFGCAELASKAGLGSSHPLG